MYRFLQEVKLGTGQQVIEKAYREVAGYGMMISESQLAELLASDFQNIEFLAEWLAGDQPHFLMDVIATILVGKAWPRTKTSEEKDLRLFCEEFSQACRQRDMDFSFNPEENGVAKALLGLSRERIEELSSGLTSYIGTHLQEAEVVAILQNVNPATLRNLKKDRPITPRTIDLFIDGLAELVEKNEQTKIRTVDVLNDPEKWLQADYLPVLCRDLFSGKQGPHRGEPILVERGAGNDEDPVNDEAALEANLEIVDRVFDDPEMAAIETLQKVVLNIGRGDGFIENKEGRFEVMPDTTLALLGVAAGYCIGTPHKNGETIRQLRMANLLAMIEVGYAAANGWEGDVRSLADGGQPEKETIMEENKNGRVEVEFKFPVPKGMTVENMPQPMRLRLQSVAQQALSAAQQADELGEALLQTMGGFLIENGFSVKEEGQIAIAPEIIAVLLGITAGHVAATDSMSQKSSKHPGFEYLVQSSYRKNLLEAFRVGLETTVCKLDNPEESSPETEEEDQKRGELVQFPVDRVIKSKDED